MFDPPKCPVSKNQEKNKIKHRERMLTVLSQLSNIPSQEFLFFSLDDTAYSHKDESYNIIYFSSFFCLWEEKNIQLKFINFLLNN